MELDVTTFGADPYERAQETGAVNADLTPREVTRHRCQRVLFADALLVARKADRRQGAGDEQESR